MPNGEDTNTNEWNRWRGEQQTILKMLKEEQEETNIRLQRLEKKFYIMKGKSLAYGAVAGATISIVVALVGYFI